MVLPLLAARFFRLRTPWTSTLCQAPLAIPLDEWRREPHPVLKLYRLCDAAEVMARFLAAAAMGEWRVQAGGALPQTLLDRVRRDVERPTFGRWRALLADLVADLHRGHPLVLPELPEFARAAVLPLMPGGNAGPDSCLIRLRNDLAHGGAVTRAAAEAALAIWGPRGEALAAGLGFLAGATLCHFAGGVARRLEGPTAAPGEPVALAADLAKALHDCGLDGHVVLLRDGRWVDLWPLCDYGRGDGPRPPTTDSPLVYARAERDRLHFAALGGEPPLAERREGVAAFRAFFRLDDRATGTSISEDFEEDLRRDAAALVGRAEELRQAKAAIREAGAGVLWIGGPGGVGKSFLMARLATDLAGDPRQVLRIAWRFRAGDGARCSRLALFRHAITRLAAWPPLGCPGEVPSRNPADWPAQFAALLVAAATLPADNRGRPPRVLFLIDGLDEIERLDPEFAEVPFRLSKPNVIWVCSGRPSAALDRLFAPDRCTTVYPGGLAGLTDADVRAMLLDGSGGLKYGLLALDREADGAIMNAVVEAVVARAGGLPLYVHFVIRDILSGNYTFAELPHRLPPGLSAYYDELLRRAPVGAVQKLLTPLVVSLAWAKAPLDEETLYLLMVRRRELRGRPGDRDLLRRALDGLGSMARPVPLAGGGVGYEPYHLTFREHVRKDEAGIIGPENDNARDDFCDLAMGWASLPAAGTAQGYVLRHGPAHLAEAGRREDLSALARDEEFLRAQDEALADDPAASLGTLRAALAAALGDEDPPVIVEFVLACARRADDLRRESPLEALQAGSLERARRLADLFPAERRLLWYLVLMGELRDAGRADEARALASMVEGVVSGLPSWSGFAAAVLLPGVTDLFPRRLAALACRLLGPWPQGLLADLYLLGGHSREFIDLEAELGVSRLVRLANLPTSVIGSPGTRPGWGVFNAVVGAPPGEAEHRRQFLAQLRVAHALAAAGMKQTDSVLRAASQTEAKMDIGEASSWTEADESVARAELGRWHPNSRFWIPAAARAGSWTRAAISLHLSPSEVTLADARAAAHDAPIGERSVALARVAEAHALASDLPGAREVLAEAAALGAAGRGSRVVVRADRRSAATLAWLRGRPGPG
jgi:hypothetical protein